ncbi:uncharacterized protein LOC132737584 [Ruditapes philippinarum]|uniref:uncharacterized protein LOC132737584 n=1 Tax=Ruditapes philippinarum TaxID=129788 RepID=UPI00295B81EE|nr:uncharacterized protein LOC132737584 [Ruditapes philippinarum]
MSHVFIMFFFGGTLTTKAPVITTKTTTSTTTPSPNSPIRCYTCGDGQGHSVAQPHQCVTQEYCQPNEMCYVTENVVGGHSSFTYGCRSKLMCRYGMKLQYDHYKLCVLNVTQPDYGLSWNAVCGSAKKRSTETCNSCCGDSGCNHGSCKYQNTHLFTLAYYGRVDMTTLKVIH